MPLPPRVPRAAPGRRRTADLSGRIDRWEALMSGTAQWLILRRHVRRAGRWILATAVAWTAGLAVFLGFTMPLWRPGQPAAAVIAVGLAGGLLMAATTSVTTGWA